MASRGPRRTSSPDVPSRDASAPAKPPRRGRTKGRVLEPSTRTPPSPGQNDLIVHPDPLRQKLDALTKEHDKLLREINKKRAQLSAAESLVKDLASSLAAQTASIKERLFTEVSAIQTLFKDLLSPASRLNRRDKAKVRRVYEEVAEMFELDINEDEPADVDFGFGADVPPPRGQSKGQHHFHDFDHGGGYSAHKPSQNNASTLRALFRKLAIAFHPDKVQDEDAKAERTSLMKDMTRAYETGDLARLMEMERTLLVHLPVADAAENVSQRVAELLKTNAELRRQSRALTSELKVVSLGLPLEVNLKAPNAAELAAIEIAGLVAALEREERRVIALRDFVSEFAQGKMSIAAFLAGPTLPKEASDDEDDFDFFQEDILMEFIDELVRKSHRAGTRRKASKRR